MKANYILITCLCCALSSALRAQTETTGVRPWSVGISSGDILRELFGHEEGPASYASFVIEHAGATYALQAGIRPGYNYSHTSHDGFVDTDVTDKVSVSGHLALTRKIFSDSRWLIRAGLRYNGGWSREDITEDSGFDRVITRRLEWNAGLGPVVDIRFFVHPRISLGTDSGLFYTISRSELQQLFTNFPDFNTTKDTVKGDKIDVAEPATIYMRFHF